MARELSNEQILNVKTGLRPQWSAISWKQIDLLSRWRLVPPAVVHFRSQRSEVKLLSPARQIGIGALTERDILLFNFDLFFPERPSFKRCANCFKMRPYGIGEVG